MYNEISSNFSTMITDFYSVIDAFYYHINSKINAKMDLIFELSERTKRIKQNTQTWSVNDNSLIIYLLKNSEEARALVSSMVN